MYKSLKIGKYHLTIELDTQEPANYLLGGFVKYYTDARHPNYINQDEEVKAPPVKEFQTRLDIITHLAEVRITNARRRRR